MAWRTATWSRCTAIRESLRDEAACTPDAVLRGNFAFDRISLANFDGTKIHEVDEIRVGTHFLAVTGRWGNNQGQAAAAGDGGGDGAECDGFRISAVGCAASAVRPPWRSASGG